MQIWFTLTKKNPKQQSSLQYFKHIPCFALQYSCITSCTSTNEKEQTRGKCKSLKQLLSVQPQNLHLVKDYGINSFFLY